MLKELNKINKPLEILSLESPLLREYGEVISGDFSEMFPEALASMDLNGPTYLADVESLHNFQSFKTLKDRFFGEIEIQTGTCFGMNDKMNGMEYHKSSEIIIAVSDVVLILGRIKEIHNNSWNSSLAKCFLIPGGTAVEIYGGTLHLAPCRVSSEPFCTIIVLPKGTNNPLSNKQEEKNPLLFMNNKWLICHEKSPAVARGAFVGIKGRNIKIKTLPF